MKKELMFTSCEALYVVLNQLSSQKDYRTQTISERQD